MNIKQFKHREEAAEYIHANRDVYPGLMIFGCDLKPFTNTKGKPVEGHKTYYVASHEDMYQYIRQFDPEYWWFYEYWLYRQVCLTVDFDFSTEDPNYAET